MYLKDMILLKLVQLQLQNLVLVDLLLCQFLILCLTQDAQVFLNSIV